MIADCAFAIGATHTVCQDYACASSGGEQASVWLSDGCSSSPDTDCGARLLARMARQRSDAVFTSAPPDVPTAWAEEVAQAAGKAARSLALPPTSLDATLLGIVVDKSRGVFRVLVYGDGVVVLGRAGGRQEVYQISYTRNFPLYLNYRNEPARAAQWDAEPGNRCQVVLSGADAEEVAVPTGPFVLERALADYLFAAVFSDGLESFTRPGREDDSARAVCDYGEVLAELTAIKSWRGEWVKRRFGRFQRDAARRGWQHADDVSMAGIFFGE